jgi:undecaprenyl-diphosphatase
MSILQAVILAIIEGLTEFIPVSSTGHMIIASSVMGIAQEDFTKFFTVAIQLGAILSVVVLYWKRFFQSIDFYFKLFIALIPAIVFGLLFNDFIDAMLGNVIVVAISLLVGGVILLFIDQWFAKNEVEGQSRTDITYPMAFKIGAFQVIAMLFPGTSRSAATIVGGLMQRLNRRTAAEFSFLLAAPTMFAATAKELYDFYKEQHAFTADQTQALIVGNVVAFVVAMLAIRFFIQFLSKNGLKIFGWYRIVIGLVILILYWMGIELSML